MDRIHRFPLINQIASQFLTLQAAVAHTDMPLPTGPTRFMPFSQQFEKGYVAVRDPKFVEYTRPRMVQLPLNKGDAVFFNPATFHQPGANETDQERVANLLQVSTAFGRSMESCDRLAMTKSVWPVMKRWHTELNSGKGKTSAQLDALIAATCSDYGYPHSIDKAIVRLWVSKET
jgi:ectoine hydroxylase-related dioxygenase (phytanoyl-CoA dioxygenase family)